MSFLKLSKFCLALSALAIIASVVLLINPGPKLSIEFTGGTLMSVRIPDAKTETDLKAALGAYEKKTSTSLGNYSVASIKSATGGKSFSVRVRDLTNEEHLALLASLKGSLGKVDEMQYNTIGPTLSSSLKKNALIALVIASFAIIIYLAFAFRKLPRKLSPWKFGVLAVVGFIHDVIVTSGLFVILSRFTSFEFDPLFVTALLTILAYSANDTIVIFDRIRANLTYESRSEDLGATVARALRQCVTRTVNTTMAALIMLVCLFFLGAESIRWFILALIVGTLIGGYSSYFIAAPLLILWKNKNK
jgi:preprotein translocase subunit SecF